MRHLTEALASKRPLAGEVGERAAPLTIAEVYRQHAQAVARWARRLGGPSVDVDDVVQEVFLAVHRKLSGFRGDSSLSTWLYRITENVVRHRRRKERWRRWLSGSAEETAGQRPSAEQEPAERIERRQAEARVYEVLDGMKEKYRNVLVLFELEEMSGEQIAELYGAKTSTVWVWLHRARADFARRLEALERQERSP